jgi:hypothetical protein
MLPLIVLAVSLVPAVAGAVPGRVSPDGVWREAERVTDSVSPVGPAAPAGLPLYDLDAAQLNAILRRAPEDGVSDLISTGAVLTIPMRDGRFERFAIQESPVFSPALAASHPEIRSYLGQGLDDATLTTRFVLTPAGFYAFIRTAEGMLYIEPNGLGNTRQSIAYMRGDLDEMPEYRCLVGSEGNDETVRLDRAPVGVEPGRVMNAPSGATLSTYDLAVSATGEFTTFFDPGGGTANTLSQIAASVAAVNAIYAPEVAIRFVVACNNVFQDPATDPFTAADNSGTSITENQTTTDANCGGSAGYDIGHVFHRRAGSGFSGLANGSACNAANKARGYSSVQNPVPATMIWVVDQLCHEMGHQFTAAHTFNSDVTGCSGNRVGTSAYEPGSGSTIMAYAAGTRCDYDFPGSNDGYFHGHSFDQITNHRDGAGACAATGATGNTPPTVNAGPDYTIPQGTPFTLTASGADADGHALTYCWEQFDLGPPGDDATDPDAPLFRSRPATTSPSRTFPILADILSGAATPTEILPLVDRTLTFRCTVRDNRATGGGVNNDQMIVTVSGSPFAVTSPDGGEVLNGGCDVPVTWTVGGGSVAPTVNILLSTDGGQSFPTTLAAATANDGSQSVTLPCVNSTLARIRIEAVGNIFFDISDDDFEIQTLAPVVTASATGGSVGPTCSFDVPFTGTITDDCGVVPASVDVQASVPAGNATVGTPSFVINPVSATEVQVSGTVTVSALTSCPAVVHVTVSGRDDCNELGSFTATAEVIDDTPPEITVTLNRTYLWPPNHKLATITATVNVTDNCGGGSYVLTSITSDEPEDDKGDGHTAPDIVGADYGTADTEFQLRSERQGGGDGRVYTITYTAGDACDNTTPGVATVRVEHDHASFALQALGFTADGTAIDPLATLVGMVVPGESLTGVAGDPGGLPDPATPDGARPAPVDLDTETLIPATVQIGNVGLVVPARRVVVTDVTGDGIVDPLLLFSAATLRAAVATMDPAEGTLGLHYATRQGRTYLLGDIFLTPTVVADVEQVRTLAALAEPEPPAPLVPPPAVAEGAPVVAEPAPRASGVVGVRPNPFSGSTAVLFDLARPARVRVGVFDAFGRQVRALAEGEWAVGRHALTWDGRDDRGARTPVGLYFVRFEGDGVRNTTKALRLD